MTKEQKVALAELGEKLAAVPYQDQPDIGEIICLGIEAGWPEMLTAKLEVGNLGTMGDVSVEYTLRIVADSHPEALRDANLWYVMYTGHGIVQRRDTYVELDPWSEAARMILLWRENHRLIWPKWQPPEGNTTAAPAA